MNELRKSSRRAPLPATLMAILLIPVFFAAWGRFGLKVPAAVILSLATGLAIRSFAELGASRFPWPVFWVWPLFVPLGMPLWLVPVALLVSWLIAVSAFGGAGKNVFNFGAVGLVFISAGYGASVSLAASKPFPGATSALSIWTAGINPIGHSGNYWLKWPVDTFSSFFAGGHLPALPGFSFPGILLALALLVVLSVPGRRVWFFSTIAASLALAFVVGQYRPEILAAPFNIFMAGSFAATLWLALADENSVPISVSGQLVFALVFAVMLVWFICASHNELAGCFALLLAQAISPLIADIIGADR